MATLQTPARRCAGEYCGSIGVWSPGCLAQVRWSCSLVWDDDREQEAPKHRRLSPDEQLLEAGGVAGLEPHLAEPPPQALHLRSDGAIDPVATTQALVLAARSHGARLVATCAVSALRVSNGQVLGVETSIGFLPATHVVVTAGVDAATLCAQPGVNLPIAPSPALLVRLTAPPGLVRTLVATPHLEVREAADGRLLVADYQGEIDEQDLQCAGEEMLRRLRSKFRNADDVCLESVRLGARPAGGRHQLRHRTRLFHVLEWIQRTLTEPWTAGCTPGWGHV